MKLEPPQPPTAPAPAVRPTPPTPPRIDKAPFVKEDSEGGTQTSDDVYENMARDAVANGSGALTKRTVDRGDDRNQNSARQNLESAQVEDTQSEYDRGQDVLREFREMDAREARQADNFSYKAETESEQTFTPKINHNEGHGGAFWIFTIIFVAVAAFFFAKKFLFTSKPALTKSQLFDDGKLKAATDKKSVPPPPKPAEKPARLPNKSEDDKPKHFEVRI